MPELEFREDGMITIYSPLPGSEHACEECDCDSCGGCNSETRVVTSAIGGWFVSVVFTKSAPGGNTFYNLLFVAQIANKVDLVTVAGDLCEAFSQCVDQHQARITAFCR
jgi:hypothetical protein